MANLSSNKPENDAKLNNVGREKFMQEITKLLQEIKDLKDLIGRQEREIEQKNRTIEEYEMKNMGAGNFNYERMKAQAREEETDKVNQAAAPDTLMTTPNTSLHFLIPHFLAP